MQTKYFNVDTTGLTTMRHFYELLLQFAEKWEERQIIKLAFFKAGFTNVYFAITAARWFEYADGNDPNWIGDAEDIIHYFEPANGSYLSRSRLRSKPYLEKKWPGKWQEFSTADELKQFAQNMLARLAEKSGQQEKPAPTILTQWIEPGQQKTKTAHIEIQRDTWGAAWLDIPQPDGQLFSVYLPPTVIKTWLELPQK